MSDVITGPGDYVEVKNGLPVRVTHLEGGWAFGFYADGQAGVWECDNGYSPYYHDITAPKPAFKPGDLVLVDCEGSRWHQHYGTVAHTDSISASVRFGEDACIYQFSHLKPVTLPAPLPQIREQQSHWRDVNFRRRIELPSEAPQPEWTCTPELRARRCTGETVGCIQWMRMSRCEWDYCIFEQKWTRGTEEEWRPVKVTDGP